MPTASMADSHAYIHGIASLSGTRRTRPTAMSAAANPATVRGKPIDSAICPPIFEPAAVRRYARRAIADDAGTHGSGGPSAGPVDVMSHSDGFLTGFSAGCGLRSSA